VAFEPTIGAKAIVRIAHTTHGLFGVIVLIQINSASFRLNFS
jgi:hypothetical protein